MLAILVFGMGTRAVDRTDDDYTRLVALNAPARRPESNFDEVCEYSQHRVDYLNLSANRLVSGHFLDLVKENLDLPLEMVASRDDSIQREQAAPNHVLTFDGLLSATPFVDDMREILSTIEEAYQNPVDIEFTANFSSDNKFRINLLQCRPLQVQGTETAKLPTAKLPTTPRNRGLRQPPRTKSTCRSAPSRRARRPACRRASA